MHSLQGWRKPGVQLSDRRGVSAQQPVEGGQRRPSRRLIHMHIGAVHRHRLLAHPPAYGSSHRPGRLSSAILNYGSFEVTRTNDECHKNYGLQGKRIDTLLTHTVAMPEVNSFDVATVLPAARLLARATNCPWAPTIAGCRRVELQQRSVESPHRFGGAEEKSRPQRAANPDVHATGCWLVGWPDRFHSPPNGPG